MVLFAIDESNFAIADTRQRIDKQVPQWKEASLRLKLRKNLENKKKEKRRDSFQFPPAQEKRRDSFRQTRRTTKTIREKRRDSFPVKEKI